MVLVTAWVTDHQLAPHTYHPDAADTMAPASVAMARRTASRLRRLRTAACGLGLTMAPNPRVFRMFRWGAKLRREFAFPLIHNEAKITRIPPNVCDVGHKTVFSLRPPLKSVTLGSGYGTTC
jgi:hypothetical protein